nr:MULTISPECIES: hypothetical protein [unclassified Granulicatella]
MSKRVVTIESAKTISHKADLPKMSHGENGDLQQKAKLVSVIRR